MNIIAKLLKTIQDDYELMLISHYIYWCSLYTSSEKEMQTFVHNQSLFNWYQSQIKDLELVFFDKMGGSKLKVAQIKHLYFNTLSKVGEYYPPNHILQKIRRGNNPKKIGNNLN